jgi:hypothetical protein
VIGIGIRPEHISGVKRDIGWEQKIRKGIALAAGLAAGFTVARLQMRKSAHTPVTL